MFLHLKCFVHLSQVAYISIWWRNTLTLKSLLPDHPGHFQLLAQKAEVKVDLVATLFSVPNASLHASHSMYSRQTDSSSPTWEHGNAEAQVPPPINSIWPPGDAHWSLKSTALVLRKLKFMPDVYICTTCDSSQVLTSKLYRVRFWSHCS